MLEPDEMLELIERVEEQGGEQASGRCQPSKFKLKMEGPDGVKRTKDFLTTGCGAESRFLVPYKKPKGAEGTAVACANDDRMDLWPRFSKET